MNDSNMGSNPNLIVESDFSTPINQRYPDYTGTPGYTIDRWKVPEEKKAELLMDMKWPSVLHPLVKIWKGAL